HVSDSSGAAVARAQVKIVNSETNVERSITTNNDGDYEAPDLLRGTYRLALTHPGFKVFVADNIVLESSDRIHAGPPAVAPVRWRYFRPQRRKAEFQRSDHRGSTQGRVGDFRCPLDPRFQLLELSKSGESLRAPLLGKGSEHGAAAGHHQRGLAIAFWQGQA